MLSSVQLDLHIHGLYICGFNQIRIKYICKKIPESSKMQTLNLPHTSNYVHRTYFVFMTIYVAFAMY